MIFKHVGATVIAELGVHKVHLAANGTFDATMILCNRVFSVVRKYRSRGKNSLISGHTKGAKTETEGILTLMRPAAIVEQGETTALRQRSCTTKLQTVTRNGRNGDFTV